MVEVSLGNVEVKIVSLIVGRKNIFLGSPKEGTESNDSDNVSNRCKWKDNVKLVITLSTLVLFIVIVMFIMMNIKNMYWLLIIIIGVPVYLEQIVGMYQSFGIVKKVVKSSDSGKLSLKEQVAINMLAYALWFFGKFNFFEEVIEKTYMCTNVYLLDMFVALIYVLVFSLYIFFICSFLPELIITVIKILKKMYYKLPWNDKIKSFGDYWINKIDKPIAVKSILILQWEIIGRWNLSISWIRYLLLPATFVLDIIIMFVSVLISLISYSVGYICVLDRMIKKTLNRLSNWLLRLSNKRIVAISFRIALILALICIVVLNRYQPIFKMQEANTAVLEFVASAIIIPIVFEWINSVKNNQSSCE